ncbi:MAG: glycosyltransferase [Gracilimonas sp.]|nr:glycosyltransferase [Gracilimonas sp.]
MSLPKKKFPSLIRRSLSQSLYDQMKNHPPDIIHTHFLYPCGIAIPFLKERLNCPVVLTIHGVDFYHTYNNPALLEILNKSLEKVDSIIAVGPQLKKDIATQFPHIEGKLLSINNYVDTSIFKPAIPNQKKKYRKELKLESSGFQLLCVANFRHKKGIDVLVEALSQIEKNITLEVHLIGRLDEEPKFQQNVNSKIAALGLKNLYFHGPKSRTEIIKWMQVVDGFVLPSRNEPFGISLIEAMACGLPVISTKSGGPEEILKGDWGYLIEPDDPYQLAEAIKTMIELKSFDAEGQHKYIEENYGKKRYVEEHKKLYANLH